MKPSRFINLLIVILVVIAFLAYPINVSAVLIRGKPMRDITGNGQYCYPPNSCLELHITFNPAGGPVTGTWSGSYTPEGTTVINTEIGTLQGTFEGGDGGAVSGTASIEGDMTFTEYTRVDHYTQQSVPWKGNLYANGTGNGTTNSIPPGSINWNITYSADEFQAAFQEATPTPTPGPWDLSVEKILVLQAVEGGTLVAGKPAAARVFLTWPDGTQNINVTVDFLVDDTVLGTKTQEVKQQYTGADITMLRNSFNFDIPASLFTVGSHTFTARARIGPLKQGQEQIQDPNPGNNEDVLLDQPVVSTDDITILMYATEAMPNGQVAKFLADYIAHAKPLFADIYPIPTLVIVPKSYPLRDPFLDSLPASVYVKGNMQVEALAIMRQLYNSRRSAGTPAADYAVGVFPAGYYGIDKNGMSYSWDRKEVLVASDSPASLAHEIGHDLLGGTEEYDTAPNGVGFPLPAVTIYRGSEHTLIDLQSSIAGSYINFMGSAGTGLTWVNNETWNRLVCKLSICYEGYLGGSKNASPTRPTGSVTGDGFLVSGTISTGGEVQIGSNLWLSGIEIPDLSDQTSPYTLTALDRNGNTLGTTQVLADPSVEDPAPFMAVLAAPMDSAALVFKQDGSTIATIERSANPPEVSFTGPQGALTGSVDISWDASDADGDTLTYSLLYSSDEGGSWIPLAINLAEPHFTLNTDDLPGCDGCKLQVLASDKWNTVEVIADGTFSIPNKSPSLAIGLPADGSTITAGQPTTFLVVAFDPEEGLLTDANVEWQSDQDGNLGSGDRLELSNLSVGAHTITVTARDSSGAEGQATMQITVAPTDETGTNPTPGPTPGPVDSTLLLLVIGGGCCCVVVIAVIVVIVLVTRKKKQAASPPPYYPPQR